MKSLVALILVLCLTAPCEAGRFSALIANAAASTKPGGPVPPAPAPQPSGKCENCDGTGITGDGTIKNKCIVCNGTGKATKSIFSAGGQWRWSEVDGDWVPVASGTNAQPRGHWEERVVCRGRQGCETVRVFVSD